MNASWSKSAPPAPAPPAPAPPSSARDAPERTAQRAALLAARLPPLLVAAQAVAATVAQGMHGRRVVGQGESFWQFRPFAPGDAPAWIDWRRSARATRPGPEGWLVRQREWAAAETVHLWRDPAARMDWSSAAGRGRFAASRPAGPGASADGAGNAFDDRAPALSTKRARAELLLLALASLLLRGGERVALIGEGARPATGLSTLERLASRLAAGAGAAWGPSIEDAHAFAGLPQRAQIVLLSDFLIPVPAIRALLARLAAIGASGTLLQILDPAEETLPYAGRVHFLAPDGAGPAVLMGRVEAARAAYAARLAAHRAEIAALAAAAGFRFLVHHTDRGAETALLSLYAALAGR